MIKDFEFYHGIVLSRLLHNTDRSIAITRFSNLDNASYVVNGELGIYIKFSKKRMSPWSFTFTKNHQDEILKMSEKFKQIFVTLVCGNDGIACLSFKEFKQILDNQHEDIEWVSVSRGARKMYSVKGRDGALAFKLGNNEFPNKLFSDVESVAITEKDIIEITESKTC